MPNQLDYYRHEALHTAFLVMEMFNDHVADSVYASSGINPDLSLLIEKANQALYAVYNQIDKDNEKGEFKPT